MTRILEFILSGFVICKDNYCTVSAISITGSNNKNHFMRICEIHEIIDMKVLWMYKINISRIKFKIRSRVLSMVFKTLCDLVYNHPLDLISITPPPAHTTVITLAHLCPSNTSSSFLPLSLCKCYYIYIYISFTIYFI